MKLQPQLVLTEESLAGERLVELAPLPAVISYYDDFADCYRQVVRPAKLEVWSISFDGHTVRLDFGCFEASVRKFIKSWCGDALSRLAPCTVVYYFQGLRKLETDSILEVLHSSPSKVRTLWKVLQAKNISYNSFEAVKSLLFFMASACIGSWIPAWVDLISQLPLPKRDKYAAVRVGEVFLPAEQEAAIVRYIDRICQLAKQNSASLPDELLGETCILICSYQFGLRAKQIAMLEMRNIRIWDAAEDEGLTVDLTFLMIKQRSAKAVFPMVRRVKREWAP